MFNKNIDQIKAKQGATKIKEKASDKKKVNNVEEDVFIIELLKEKKGDTFLVKWETFSQDEDSWEPRSSIPEYILKVTI